MTGKPRGLGPHRQTVIDNVAWLRAQEHMSFNELSRQLEKRDVDIAPLGLRRMEAGTRSIDVDELVALADVFHVPVTTLLDKSAVSEYRKRCLQWLLAEAEWREQ